MALTPGSRLGPYEIQSPLGAGGMGEVWKAFDTRLERTVAVKQLRTGHGTRFKQEARAIAALNHPHICHIYDIGEDYLVLEYVEGQTLRGPLPAEEAVKVALQIAEALEEAHSHGILHRDLKPANILLTPKGVVKLLDFGLAKLLASDSGVTDTAEGTVLGTAAYMSPEQAQGVALDARSDIFSFGTVLYEILSGARAFDRGSMMATLYAVVWDEPAAIQTSPALDSTLRRCLRKNPAERFQTMAEVRSALEGRQAAAVEQQASIAVLPFANMSADQDQEYFSDGLAEEIINLLAQTPGLKVIARTSAFAFRGREQDIRKIAEALGVQTVVEGSVRRIGNRIRVTAQLIAAADGSHLFSQRYDRELTDIFDVQDEIAGAIASALRVRLTGGSGASRQYTPALPAYEAYLRGKYHQQKANPEGLELSRQCYEEAIRLDPGYALPHAGLGLYYYLVSVFGGKPSRETIPQARAEALEALRIDPSLSEAHAMLGTIELLFGLNWRNAEVHFTEANAHQPISAQARQQYAVFCCFTGRLDAAIRLIGRNIEEDPLEIWPRMNLQFYLQAAGREDECYEQLKKVIELNDRMPLAHVSLTMLLTHRGALDEALASARKAYEVAPWYGDSIAALAALLRLTGDSSGSEKMLMKLSECAVFGRARCYALYHVCCGELDMAADYVEASIEERDLNIMFRLRHSVFRRLHTTPRWQKIVQMLSLPEEIFRVPSASASGKSAGTP